MIKQQPESVILFEYLKEIGYFLSDTKWHELTEEAKHSINQQAEMLLNKYTSVYRKKNAKRPVKRPVNKSV